METTNEYPELTEGQAKAIALKQFNDEEFFFVDGNDDGEITIFEGNEEEAREGFRADIEGTEEVEIESNFLIYCQNNLTEIDEIDGDDETDGYMVLTDDEANEKWEASLDSYLEECIYPELPEVAKRYFDDEAWKRDARHDGRGHSINSYDGGEDEETVNGVTYYIYRVS